MLEPVSEETDRRTEAEKRFDEQAAKKEILRLKQKAGKSHRQRIAEYNEQLTNLSEHHDIPKVCTAAFVLSKLSAASVGLPEANLEISAGWPRVNAGTHWRCQPRGGGTQQPLHLVPLVASSSALSVLEPVAE